MRLANSVGIIDSGYRGELMAKVDLLSQTNEYDDESLLELYGYKRHFQLCSHNLLPFKSVELVESLDDTTRGTGGFGSTG
jgi:dUTP pyrophosphatase